MVIATGMRVLAFQRISNGLQVGLGGVGIAPSKQAQWGWLCAGACAFISTKEAENAILLHYAFLWPGRTQQQESTSQNRTSGSRCAMGCRWHGV